MNDPGKLARRLLATLLPVIELNCNDHVNKEVMRAADGCISAYQHLIRLLMMHDEEISSVEEKSRTLQITRDEVFKQMSNPELTVEVAEAYRNYLMHLNRLIEAHDGGWRERMFPISPEPDTGGNALKNTRSRSTCVRLLSKSRMH
ncbi:hypothetical protein KFE96_04980 [Kordiimonas sp. SCSIO 12603]|uniref:hypothetical protein n=1 Tax=Kordiimonas sp. SCSIO 12603 TaxID=2829596 RepID=UPI0021034793|nr:hypothetical protein [Kordiimonas sp. SCSIO 12603]UTW59660.1 hypothetical protein KFE96_04980 [Kordiimonas sp. SCSIO 12603]